MKKVVLRKREGDLPLNDNTFCSEFNFIHSLQRLSSIHHPWVDTGIGDDCAVLALPNGRCLLLTTDMLINRVHFQLKTLTPFELGWKSLAVNLSDIAAMGGRPVCFLLSIGITPDLPAQFLDEFKQGLFACGNTYQVDLVGGDTVISRTDLCLNLTVVGESETVHLLRRSGAQNGDIIVLGRPTGESAAGLHMMLENPPCVLPTTADVLRKAHVQPTPQLELGQMLAQEGLASAAIDISDGLLQDLGHVCEQSGLGAEIDAHAVPLSDALVAFSHVTGVNALDLALAGGEDYALLFCVPVDRLERCQELAQQQLGCELYPIGHMCKQKGLWLSTSSGVQPIAPRGYDAFREGLQERKV